MKKLSALTGISFLILFTGCAPTTFLIGKDGNAAYFGRDRACFRKLLCIRGELDAVLASAELTNDQKKDFRTYVCSDERSFEKVLSLYLFLTPDEKSSLKKAFEKHGYDVNYIRC